jgi:REP element-mobilizing transposase RayT
VLGGVCRRYRLVVLAYCLMSNHYHLLVRTPDANLARAMRQLNGVYAQAYNRRHVRTGHLFQGRYGARLVQEDGHLLASVRYIVRNPLRAAICERLDDWRWSSHLQMLGKRPAGFLARGELLAYLGATRQEARARYLELVESEGDPSTPAHPLVEGDEEFVADRLRLVMDSPEFPRFALRPVRRPLRELVANASDAAGIAAAHLEHGYSMRAIATHLGCGVTTVHRRVRAHEAETRGTWKT